MDPRTGQILTVPGAPNTQAAIGTPIPGTGQPDQRHQRRRVTASRRPLHVADAGRRPALRRGLRPERQPEPDLARRRRSSTTVRTATPCSRSRATRRSRRRPTCGTAAPERSAARACDRRRAGARDLPVRREGAGVRAVAGRRPEDAAVGVGRRRLVCRQPRLQPARRLPGRHDRQPERGRLRRGLPAAEPGPDAGRERGARRERLPTTCCGRTAGSATSTRTRPSSGTRITPSRLASTAASATGSRSA